MALFAVRRADIEGFARDLEAMGRARATVTRRLSTIAGFYNYVVQEELLDRSDEWIAPEHVLAARCELGDSGQGVAVVFWRLRRETGRETPMSSPAPADRPRSGLSRRQALAGFGIALIGGVSARAVSARAAVAPARHARAGLAAGLTNLQLAGQRVIGSYPGLTPPASLFTDISAGQVAGVIFFGENIPARPRSPG